MEELSKSLIPLSDCPFLLNHLPVILGKSPCYRFETGNFRRCKSAILTAMTSRTRWMPRESRRGSRGLAKNDIRALAPARAPAAKPQIEPPGSAPPTSAAAPSCGVAAAVGGSLKMPLGAPWCRINHIDSLYTRPRGSRPKSLKRRHYSPPLTTLLNLRAREGRCGALGILFFILVFPHR
jgi:hypothetical protein